MTHRIRVLVLAESCNPEWESVPLQGWCHYAALRDLVETHLVTRNWNRPALLRQGLVEGRDFTCIDTDRLFKPAEALVRKISGPNKGFAMLTGLSIPSYLLFEQIAWRRFRHRLRSGEFSLVHRITPTSPAVPSIIAPRLRRARIPFVFGPLNGGLAWPPQFPELQRREGEWLSRLREVYRLIPGYRATRRDAAAILVASASAWADMPRRYEKKLFYMPENGIQLERFPRPARRPAGFYAGRPLRAAFLGRLVPYKGADMVIEAATPLLLSGRLTLDIIGFGPEQPGLEAMVAERSLSGAVSFAGKVPHAEVAARLARADLLTFPSVHEFGGAAVLEAMAAGLVPVVVDYGGPGELVTPQCGFPLPLADRDGIVASLRAVLHAVADDPAQLAALSAAAIDRAFDVFAWPAKARQTAELYRYVLGLRDRPDMPRPRSAE